MFVGGHKDHHPPPEPQDETTDTTTNKIDFFTDSNMASAASKPQELTLSYLCEHNNNNQHSKLGLGLGHKGKEVAFSAQPSSDPHLDQWVERDFLNLTEPNSDDAEIENQKNKKPKLEGSLNLSLALPDVSFSLQNGVNAHKPVALTSLPAPSNNNTQTTCSNDFTAPNSLSCSFSHAFSHNPSCSMTCNSTENYDFNSAGRDDRVWCGGEGTNGSVHSRFRPIGNGGILALNKDSSCNNNNSVYRATSSDNNISFFPSELPARPCLDTYSGDSRKRGSENLRGLDDGGRVSSRSVSRPERIVREIVSESIPVMAQIVQELTPEMLNSIKDYVKSLVSVADHRDELVGLQSRLERRSDLVKESLLKCQKDQLEILVAVKMGLASFVSGKVRLPAEELIEMYLFVRCRNVNCKSILPVEDCDCKFCSANNGFCSSCMCPVCMKFDCASNTCSWVGCDVCSHWCHAACGIQKNLIRPGPTLKGPSGTSEMQFHCIACNHASEMFGFVKDVYTCCAKDWGFETLLKELDCVRKIFKGSDDFKGKELHTKADGLISKLEDKLISPKDACHIILKFFDYADRLPDFPTGPSAKEMMPRNTEPITRKEATPIPQHTSLPPRYTTYNNNNTMAPNDNNSVSGSSTGRLGTDLHRKMEDELQHSLAGRKDGFESLESIVRIKQAESRMFQNKADEARREAEGLKRMIQVRTDKYEEEYAQKLSKLCLKETEDRRRKKLEDLKKMENSHCDYYNMKMRMQAEIAGLLERMEATKQQRV
ncbi:Protein OBERON 3 [Linum perenne]